MTTKLLSEGRTRPRGRGLRLPHLMRFLLPQLHHLFYLSHLHPHLFFQFLSLQDHQILLLHHRCCIPCSRASTEGWSPGSGGQARRPTFFFWKGWGLYNPGAWYWGATSTSTTSSREGDYSRSENVYHIPVRVWSLKTNSLHTKCDP